MAVMTWAPEDEGINAAWGGGAAFVCRADEPIVGRTAGLGNDQKKQSTVSVTEMTNAGVLHGIVSGTADNPPIRNIQKYPLDGALTAERSY
jgi:hypothetical protein